MHKIFCPFLLFSFFSCIEKTDEMQQIKSLINMVLQQGVDATKTKNIDLYMEALPPDLAIYDESGEVISRAMQREYALREWSIIDTTLSIAVVIDSLIVHNDSATVFTSQKWERLMFQKDGITTNTVITTQKHQEGWKNGRAAG
jgi:hypothetical protein